MFLKQLVEFARSLNAEERRGISENLKEEELALLDLFTKPEIELTAAERTQVKNVARELLATLKERTCSKGPASPRTPRPAGTMTDM